MAQCKECGQVVAATEIENGVCKNCLAGMPPKEVEYVEETEEAIVYNNNIFSFKGRIGRVQYLLSGVLLTFGLIAVTWYLAIKTETIAIIFIGLLGALYIGLAALTKRARDINENVVLIIIITLIPYLGLIAYLYLLLAPSKKGELRSNSVLRSILVVVFIFILLGILAAVAIPKLSQHRQEGATHQTVLQTDIETLEALDEQCRDDKQDACEKLIDICDNEDNGRACGKAGYQAVLKSMETKDTELVATGISYLNKGCEELEDDFSCLVLKKLESLSDEDA